MPLNLLLIIGVICSAIFKRKNYVYIFILIHGMNGLSSPDSSSFLITFLCLDDLIAYLYAFYDSFRIDMNFQCDFLPVTISKYEHTCNFKRL